MNREKGFRIHTPRRLANNLGPKEPALIRNIKQDHIEYHFSEHEDTPFTQSVRSATIVATENTPAEQKTSTTQETPAVPEVLQLAHQRALPNTRFNVYSRSSAHTFSDPTQGGGLQNSQYTSSQPTFRTELRHAWNESNGASKVGFLFGATHTRSSRSGRLKQGYKLGDELRTYDTGEAGPLTL
jgi:hypothetical protein